MRIAVIEHAESGDYTEYIFSLIREKAGQHNYQVKAWSYSVPASQQKIAADAVVFISIEAKTQFLLNWLYKIKLPSILRKIKADIVIDLNGIASRKIKIPQLITAGQFFFNENKKQLKKIEKYALKNFKQSQAVAKNILIYSAQKKTNITVADTKKLKALLYSAPGVFKTFEWHEKIMVKAQYADNKEYFIAMIEDEAVNDFVLLLQAFSKFKKWQQSSMQLLIFPKFETFGEDIIDKHKTYKYRDDVQLLEDVEEKEMASVVASAYAFVHVATTYPQLLFLSIAMQCSLPVISFQDEDVKEYTGDAALISVERNFESLGNLLIELYKNESLHARLKEAAQKQVVNLNRQVYEDELWQMLTVNAKQ